MKKLIYSAMSAAILLGSAGSALACDSPKNQACQQECSRVYPDDNQTSLLIACVRGCAIATKCQFGV